MNQNNMNNITEQNQALEKDIFPTNNTNNNDNFLTSISSVREPEDKVSRIKEKKFRSSKQNLDEISDLNYEIPLNILKEKVLYCLPPGTEIEEECYYQINKALNNFLKYFALKLPYQQENDEKKILIKDIKNCIDDNESFAFLKRLIEK